ncbi:hypothetical protein [Tolypothrix sp. NIES-4075]|nr:hypothetical protein [Tolypothrix sp. NIES-4075]
MITKKDTLGNIQIHDRQRAIKYTVNPVVGVPMPSIPTGSRVRLE